MLLSKPRACRRRDFLLLRKRLKATEAISSRKEAKMYSNMFKGLGGDGPKTPHVVSAEA